MTLTEQDEEVLLSTLRPLLPDCLITIDERKGEERVIRFEKDSQEVRIWVKDISCSGDYLETIRNCVERGLKKKGAEAVRC